MRGRKPSGVGPAASLLNSLRAPTPIWGKTATKSTTIPMPPTQCIRQRHRFVARLRPLTSDTTVAPVVVKPLTDSKKAPAASGIDPSTMNGTAPSQPMSSHTSATAPSASLRCTPAGAWRPKRSRTPASAAVSSSAAPYPCTAAWWPSTSARPSGAASRTTSMTSRLPTRRATTLGFNAPASGAPRPRPRARPRGRGGWRRAAGLSVRPAAPAWRCARPPSPRRRR